MALPSSLLGAFGVVAVAVAGSGLIGCSGQHPGTILDAASDVSDTPQAGADVGIDAAPDAGASEAPRDAAPPQEVGTFELPRTPADPKSTRKLVPGAAILVGSGPASCSHDPAAAGDRWCAFSRPAATGQGHELWAINGTRAAQGPIPVCDGTSELCRRLTTNLWTGTPIWGPSHPTAHRFEGDTLLYHANEAPGARDPYQGAIWTWRATWPAPRQITSDRGVLCYGEHRSASVFCLDNAVIDKDPTSPFDRPRLREFDLLAGKLDGSSGGPLATVVRLKNEGSDLAWRARFTAGGEYLVYSSVPVPNGRESLYSIKTADAGKATPTLILEDVADWEISHDGTKIYFLKGYDRSRGENASGTLMLADFPSGAGPVELHQNVLWFELLGTQQGVTSTVDRGLLFAWAGAGGLPNLAVLRDRAKPDDLFLVGNKVEAALVSVDARHTAYFQEHRGVEFPSAFVAQNDGSGRCQLTADIRAETYGLGFSDDARRVFWIEYGRNRSESEEGWYARPDTCGDRVKFGDFVGWYALVGNDFVLFDGGDLDDTTRWLQYTSLRPSGSGPATPLVIQERPEGIVGLLEFAGTVWTLFSTGGPDAALYLHGPLRHPAP